MMMLWSDTNLHQRARADAQQVLGIDRQANDKQIKSAYRQLSKKFHPDKNP